METQKPKIAMYAKRSFGEKMNASFDFIKENWKPMLKYLTYFLLPLSLVQAVSSNVLLNSSTKSLIYGSVSGLETQADDLLAESLLNSFISSLLLLVGTLLFSSLIYSFFILYNEREERLQQIQWGDLKPHFFRSLRRLIPFFLMSFFLAGVFCLFAGVLVAALGWYTIIFSFVLLIALGVPLALSLPIYLFEKRKVWASLGKSFRLGFPTWGGTFAIILVMGILALILQGVTAMPWYVATVIKTFFIMSDTGNEVTMSAGYGFFVYLLTVLQVFGSYVAMIFSTVGIIYQYGHASETMDNVTVTSDIENFDKL